MTLARVMATARRAVGKWRGRWMWLVVMLLGALLIGDLVRVWRITNHHDLDVYVLAARRLLAGEDIYADGLTFRALIESGKFSMKDNTVVWPFVCSPFLAIVLVPATWLPAAVGQAVWWAINVGALLLGGWLVLRAMGPITPGRVALLLLVAYRFEPAVITLRLGQTELVQFALLAWALYAQSRGQEARTGLALGLAAGLKFTPILLVVLFIWRRRWRAALWAVGVFMLITVASFAVAGFDVIPTYLQSTAIYGLGGAFAAFPYNQSLNGVLSRNLIRNAFNATLKGLHLPWLAKGLTILGSLGIASVSAYLTWHREGRHPAPTAEETQRFSLEFALAVVALLLVSPYSQVYVFVWLLLSILVLALWLLSQRERRVWLWAGLVVAYALLGRNLVLYRPGLTRLVQAHYLFGALLLWALLAGVLYWGLGKGHPSGQAVTERSSE